MMVEEGPGCDRVKRPVSRTLKRETWIWALMTLGKTAKTVS